MRIVDILNEASIFDERTLINTEWKHPGRLAKWLKSNGFQELGAGSFSAVYIQPGYNRVIKVSKQQDECWIRFAKWSMQYTANRHLPNIKWMKVYGSGEFFIALIEKLVPFTAAHIKHMDIADIALLYAEEAFLEKDQSRAAVKRLIDEEVLDEHNIFSPEALGITRAYAKEYATPFVQTYKAVKRKLSKAPCVVDLHDQNLMFRPSNNSVVLIDPLADM